MILLLGLSCGDGATEPPAPEPPRPTSVVVSPTAIALAALDETAQLTAQVLDQRGQVIVGVPIIWQSSDPSVATVDATGLVRALANGTATITATAGAISGTAAATVAQQANAVTVAPSDTQLVQGDTLRFTAEATDANGHAMDNAEFTWSSSDTTIARVDRSGLVLAVAQGTATITAATDGVEGRSEVSVTVPSSQDRAALEALYEATGGPNWTSSDNWLSDRALKDWHGVRVDPGGRVIALALAYNNLTGSLPAEIGDLSALVEARLSANSLTGTLPGELGKLSDLRHLDLNDNNLADPLPAGLFGLSRLKDLLLGGNDLSGPIPPELGTHRPV